MATRRAQPAERLERAAQWLGLCESEALAWINRQEEATPGLLLKLARMFAAKFAADRACRHLQDEADAFAFHLSSSNEEVNLLFRLTQHLKLSRSVDELGSMTLDWLSDVLPAQSLVLQLAQAGRPRCHERCGQRKRAVAGCAEIVHWTLAASPR